MIELLILINKWLLVMIDCVWYGFLCVNVEGWFIGYFDLLEGCFYKGLDFSFFVMIDDRLFKNKII